MAQKPSNNDNDNGDEIDGLFSVIDQTTKFLATPLLFGLPNGIPLALLSTFVFTSIPQGLVTLAFFSLYFWFGQWTVLSEESVDGSNDDDGKIKVSIFALFASILSAGILSPVNNAISTSSTFGPSGIVILVVATTVTLILQTLPILKKQTQQHVDVEKEADANKQLLDIWDAEFRARNTDGNRENDN